MRLIRELPSGGMATRIACGRSTRCITCQLVMPRDLAASICPSSTDRSAARIVAEEARAYEEARKEADEQKIMYLASQVD